MKQVKSFLWLSSLLLCLSSPEAQEPTRLGLGDSVPDLLLTNYLQLPLPQKSISALKGRWMILDFWGVHCGVCVKSMPKMEQLQKKFADKLQIILITPDSREEVENLFKKINRKTPQLPMIVGDTTFVKFFPAVTYPHHVWIDNTNTVKYITSYLNATEEHLDEVLNGRSIDVREKREAINSQPNKLLWTVGMDKIKSSMLSYSCFTRGLKEQRHGGISWIRDSTGEKTGLALTNMGLLNMLQFAYADTEPANQIFQLRSRVQVLAQNCNKLLPPLNEGEIDTWQDSNLLCYELNGANRDGKEMLHILKEDLLRYFPYNVSIEERFVDCLGLTGGDLRRLKSTSTVPEKKFRYESFTLKKHPVSDLVRALNFSNPNIPEYFVDATGYTGNIDITIAADLNNLPRVKEILAEYGLHFQPQKKKLRVLVIRDKDASTLNKESSR